MYTLSGLFRCESVSLYFPVGNISTNDIDSVDRCVLPAGEGGLFLRALHNYKGEIGDFFMKATDHEIFRGTGEEHTSIIDTSPDTDYM